MVCITDSARLLQAFLACHICTYTPVTDVCPTFELSPLREIMHLQQMYFGPGFKRNFQFCGIISLTRRKL